MHYIIIIKYNVFVLYIIILFILYKDCIKRMTFLAF